ncbi:tetratricopeptide repeat protein [Clostridium tertium]|uniref:tetratricopeptide repeat protein n=1 Tax=Clostridium tertium TaxID=1559 RepID=UPI00241FF2D3|nr:tetratricopeptide repeat protein [Clostridium tertium]
MNKKFIKLTIIPLFLILSTSLFACTDTTKKVTVSNNTSEEILVEENEVDEAITNAKKLLTDNKYDEAKAYFNKAISLDKSNKDLYLEIKDIYMNSNKYDDAYFIIKSALANNVDTENMKSIAKEISSKFEVIKLADSIYQESEYNLPGSVSTDINGTSLSLPLTWNVATVDTSSAGTFTYYGTNEEYGRHVEFTLTVLKNVYDKQIGCINNIYSIDGKTYIDVDLVEFYFGNEIALREALKDNEKIAYLENGEPYVPDGYYIRNNNSKLTTYEISSNCSFQLLNHDFLALGYNVPPPKNSSINEEASFNDFINYIDLRNPMDIGNLDISDGKPITHRETLCWIELKNGVAYSIYRQYTP